MEKRISFRDFQSAKNVAKTIDPYLVQKKKCQEQIASLEDTFKAKFTEKAQQLFNRLQEAQAKEKERLENLLEEIDHKIDLYEAGILRDTGFHTTDLVKKVIEPTGKTDANGKPLKITKYLPTDIVSYDEESKQYVVTVPDDEPIVPPTTEDGPGSDFDIDKENLAIEEESDDLPFVEGTDAEEDIF